jgi:hypothetical protein
MEQQIESNRSLLGNSSRTMAGSGKMAERSPSFEDIHELNEGGAYHFGRL